jgi:hypothetical protein
LLNKPLLRLWVVGESQPPKFSWESLKPRVMPRHTQGWKGESASAASAQERPDPQLLAFINTIRAVDNHSHALPARAPEATAARRHDLLTDASESQGWPGRPR